MKLKSLVACAGLLAGVIAVLPGSMAAADSHVVRLQSYNYQDRYIRHRNFDVRLDADVSPFEDSQFRMVQGLANSGSGYVSFESVNFPGYYLRHANFDFALVQNDGSALFRADATFRQVAGLANSSWSSFQSYNFPDRYLRHSSFLLRLDPISDSLGRSDATFRVVTGGTTPPPPSGLVGWATQGGGTTGGAGGSTVTVSSASALSSALSSSSRQIIRVSGTISCSGMLRVASNKSVLGNSGATIAGCGFNISEASNVIVRNLTFRDWNDDAVNVQYSTRVWVDHNSFTNGYDGAVDIKRASDYVTVSWNRYYNHGKTMLLGHSDDNGSEDRGRLRVSYHHNWFDGTNSRHPRVRFGNPVHVFNNFYSNIGDYGVASTMEGGVLVEGNYFENTDSPCELGQGSSPAGSLVQRSNHFTGSGSCQSGGSVRSIPYSYTLDTPSNVKSIVTGGAGAGRINV